MLFHFLAYAYLENTLCLFAVANWGTTDAGWHTDVKSKISGLKKMIATLICESTVGCVCDTNPCMQINSGVCVCVWHKPLYGNQLWGVGVCAHAHAIPGILED